MGPSCCNFCTSESLSFLSDVIFKPNITIFLIPRTKCFLFLFMFLLTKHESHSKETLITTVCTTVVLGPDQGTSRAFIGFFTVPQNNYSKIIGIKEKRITQNCKVLYLHVTVSLQLFNNLFVLCLGFIK